MQFALVFVIVAAAGTACAANIPRAWPKANEYKSGDCGGPMNYEHHSPFLKDVTMDDTSHSVYLAGGTWELHSGKTENGGSCNGAWLGVSDGGCVNLDNGGQVKERIRCVSK
ncbi:hypothetical protein GGR57DRAFT_499873 [Xylariaceae sp. FL1272]|nr:hypothetical protein GGR57DRAFT_499873 [Xylariaceae sp. FL1272]